MAIDVASLYTLQQALKRGVHPDPAPQQQVSLVMVLLIECEAHIIMLMKVVDDE